MGPAWMSGTGHLSRVELFLAVNGPALEVMSPHTS